MGSACGDGQGVESSERGSGLLGPGPALLDPDPDAALTSGDPGSDVQQPVAQRLRFGFREGAVEDEVLGPGEQVDASITTVSQAELIAKVRDGKWFRPVSLAVRMRSSTRAWARCRASRKASYPAWVSVAKQV